MMRAAIYTRKSTLTCDREEAVCEPVIFELVRDSFLPRHKSLTTMDEEKASGWLRRHRGCIYEEETSGLADLLDEVRKESVALANQRIAALERQLVERR
jgi:hypothetical protein